MIGPHANCITRKQRFDIFQQKLVLEDSARQNDRVQRVRVAQSNRATAQTRGHASLEGPRNLARVSATLPVSDDALQQRPEVQLPAGEGKGFRMTRSLSALAACPSKEISRVNPSRAATVSKSRPIEVVEKVRMPLVTSSAAFPNR